MSDIVYSQDGLIASSPRPASSTNTASKTIRGRERLFERLRQRITHNYNEMSPDEIKVHDCLVMDEFSRKNPDIKLNISKHQRMKEALESEEVRTTLVKVGTPGYNWELGTSIFTPHPLPINSEFHNAQLTYIAGKSHRRSAFDLQKARGKRRLIIIIIILRRFNPPPNFSNGILPFLSLYSSYTYRFYSTIESIIHQEVQISH